MIFAVCGLHLRGGALNAELVSFGASFVRAAHTSAHYKMYAVTDASTPQKPALVHFPGATDGTAQMPVELWDLPDEAVGAFLARVPSPLGFGTVVLDGGERVKGFIAESWAADPKMAQCMGVTTLDVTKWGGWNNYVKGKGEEE